MDEVPDELLANIFSYLSIKSIFAVYNVNVAWRNCCDTYEIFSTRVLAQVPHLKSLLTTDIVDVTLRQLVVSLEKKYLILGGNEEDLANIQRCISRCGLTVEVYNPANYDSHNLLTLDQLKEYGAVLVYNDSGIFQSHTEELGNMLARYLEGGHGGVVQCVFALNSNCLNGIPTGEYQEKLYCPLEYASQTEFHVETELVKEIPDHFLLVGVDTFTQPRTASHCPAEKLQEGIEPGLATVVARYNDISRTIAVACREIKGENKGRVCALNFYPSSNESSFVWSQQNAWNKESNGAELMTNALLYCSITTNRK
jgi:hypothetical protein